MLKLKKNKGITLVALIVTIIILLILAGITIGQLTNSGLLGNAKQSAEKYGEAADKEEIALQYQSYYIDELNSNKSFMKYLEEKGYDVDYDNDEGTSGTVTINKNKYKVSVKNGKVETEPVGGGDNWTYNHSEQTVKKGDLEIKIGDYVKDTGTQSVSGFDGMWRVLGVENGQILLVTNTYYAPFAEDTTNGITRSQGAGPNLYGFQVYGKDEYDNGVARLNKIGEQYNNSKLEKGRSITVNDINKITGYNPMETRIDSSDLTKKAIFGKGTISQYQNNVTYTIKSDGYVWYKGDQAETTEKISIYQKFLKIGEYSNITEPVTLKTTYYMYYPETLGTFPASAAAGQTLPGISNTSAAYDMIFKTPYAPYLTASPCIWGNNGTLGWYWFIVYNDHVQGNGGGWASNGNHVEGSTTGNTFGVRPVVCIKSDITPKLKTTDTTTGISTYEI